jgi:hypothetical protein
MIPNSRMLIALSVSGLAVLSAFGKYRKNTRWQNNRQEKKEIDTWEGEGGNPPQATEKHANKPETPGPATPVVPATPY